MQWAGLAGAGFAVSVAAQNIWSQSAGILPDPDARSARIVANLSDHADSVTVLVGWVALNVVLLALFAAGAYQRTREAEPVLARLGLVGTVMLLVLFPLVTIPVAVLSVGGTPLASSPELVEAMWSFHLTAFAFAGTALGIALLGFGLAAVKSAMAPDWFRIAAPVGAGAIILASMFAKDQAAGSSKAMFGLLGFLLWLVFLVTTGLRMWREA